MKRVIRFETSDGKMHVDEMQARSHADKRYSDHLCALAARFVKAEKYQAMKDAIDSQLSDLVILLELHADLVNFENEVDE